MADRLEALESAVRELAGELRRLQARVSDLEGRPLPAGLASTANEPAEPAPLVPSVPQGLIALVGRTLLVLAGAYVARALTDGRMIPAGVGVALGLAYAVFWLQRADREAAAGRREGAVFHALAGSLIAFPLLWETTARFDLLGAREACAALVAFFGLALAVAWRRGLAVVAWGATGLTLATAVALLVATHDLSRRLRCAPRGRRVARVAGLPRPLAALALGSSPLPRRGGVPARRPRDAVAGSAGRLRLPRPGRRGARASRRSRALRGEPRCPHAQARAPGDLLRGGPGNARGRSRVRGSLGGS
jgi:hypothetical protein